MLFHFFKTCSKLLLFLKSTHSHVVKNIPNKLLRNKNNFKKHKTVFVLNFYFYFLNLNLFTNNCFIKFVLLKNTLSNPSLILKTKYKKLKTTHFFKYKTKNMCRDLNSIFFY